MHVEEEALTHFRRSRTTVLYSIYDKNLKYISNSVRCEITDSCCPWWII